MIVQMTRSLRELLDQPIGVLGLSVRTANALDGAMIYTVKDLLQCCGTTSAVCEKCPRHGKCSHFRLMDIPNFGNKTLDEVLKALERDDPALRHRDKDKNGKQRKCRTRQR